MIFKRASAKLRAQDWMAILIELGIVILGVFIGTWVANWNQERADQAETRRMVVQLGPSVKQMSDYYIYARRYYAVTRHYADVALAGWRGDPGVSDSEFVIAAYQASQVYTLGTNGSTWSGVLGADRLRKINDPQLRSDLSYLISADYTQVDNAAVDSPYRHNVRRIIPIELQDNIRERCGDRRASQNENLLILPPACDLVIAPTDAAQAAALLRGRPDLRDDLQWHVAGVTAFLDNIVPFETASRRVEQRSFATR